MHSKNSLRQQLRQRRDDFAGGMAADARVRAFAAVPEALAARFSSGTIVAGYFPMGSEADPAPLLTAAAAAGCVLALPHVGTGLPGATGPDVGAAGDVGMNGAIMRFLRWDPQGLLEKGRFGLMQPPLDSAPCEPDIVLMPLVGFDRSLNRLGQGAGFYDRALEKLPPCFKLGIAWSVQECESLPADPWDVPLDAVLTEKEWIER